MSKSNSADSNAECLPFTGLLIELGPQRRKQIERLKRGNGALTHQIRVAVEQSRQEFGIDKATEIIPVVLIYRRGRADYVIIVPEGP
jgi:hypothetical protein